jgi:hypothetical protein
VAVAAVLFLGACFGLAWSRVSDGSSWDTDLYERYGARMAKGDVPYRDFRAEYPPGALATFVLPSELAGTKAPVWEPTLNRPARRYALWFAALMVALLATAIVLTATSLRVLRASTRQVAITLGLLAVAPLLLGDLVFTRFDVWPATLTAAALAALLCARFNLAGLALGVAIATKLYPVLLVPLAVTQAWKQRGRRAGLSLLGVTSATTLAVFLPFLALAPGETLWPVRQQLSRGLQAESLGASLISAVHAVTLQLHDHGLGVPTASLHLVESAGALNSAEVHGVAGTAVGTVSGLLALAIVAWAWVAFARGAASADRLVCYAAIVLTASLAVGRVLSPQFLIWLLPIVPLVRGRRGLLASGLLAVTVLLTNLWFPGPYRDYVNDVATGQLGPVALLVLRNLVLLALLLSLVAPRVATPTGWGRRQPPRAPNR